jgi:hypothetical protein
MGPLCRLGSVITDMPLAIEHPLMQALQHFAIIAKHAEYMSAKAIPDERSVEAGTDHLGNYRYKVDTGKCFPYFAKHNYCSACLPVCVYHHKEWAKDFEGFNTKLFPALICKNRQHLLILIYPNTTTQH